MQGRCNVKRGFPSYWGNGHDGILTAGRTLHAGSDYTKYEDFAVLELESINWNPGSSEMLTVDEPCRGLILFVDGDVNIGENATISMAKMGSILPANPVELLDLYRDSVQMRHIVDTLKTLRGGAGGDGGAGKSGHGGLGGVGGIGRICQGGKGGGGGGGGSTTTSAGDGGSVIYPEAFGHGGKDGYGVKDGFNGGGGGHQDRRGGAGGHPYGAGGGGGSYEYDDRGWAGKDGEHTGGFILIIAKGTVMITGTLDVTGGDGGDAGAVGVSDVSYPGGGAGGAGGGVIAIFTRTAVNTSGATIIKDGGIGGEPPPSSGATYGTGGQQGTLYTENLSV